MGKGELTRERIVDAAIALASRVGFDGLSIGALATELSMSKSGLFAHFGSKEELQLRVLESEVARFEREVFHPAIKAARGEPRVKALFEAWLKWNAASPHRGGCLIISASVEFDDIPGPLRDATCEAQHQLLEGIARAVKIAVEVGHFRKDVDPAQFAFEVYGIVLGHHFVRRVRQDPKADRRAHVAFDRLVQAAHP